MDSFRSEKGVIWGLTLALLALGALVAVPVARLGSTAALGSNKATQQVWDRYSADAGIEHALWRIQYQSGFQGSLNPTVTYTQSYNGRTVSLTVTAQTPPPPPPSPCQSGTGGQICISSSVSPASVTANVFQTFTYTLTIRNTGTSNVHLEEIGDLLPSTFSYSNGSAASSGIQFQQGQVLGEPTLGTQSGRQQLKWSFSSPLPFISAGQTATVTFQATATPPPGTYTNDAWVTASAESIGEVGTGETSPIVSSWPQFDLTSTAGSTTIRVRAEKQDIGMRIRSWQAQ